jgi:hypothetical protein
MTDANALRDYVSKDALGKAVYLDQANLTSPDLTFYWVKGTITEAEPITVEVTGRNKRTGDEETAKTTFEVLAPTIETFAALTCGPGIRPLRPPVLALGYNCASAPGIKWNLSVYGSEKEVGTVALTQVATVDMEHNGKPCTAGNVRLDGTKVVSYNGVTFASDTLHPLDFWIPENLTDSPRVLLRNGGTWSVDENFSDYIMFKPNLPDSRYVAIQQLSPWFFRGAAKDSGPYWGMGSKEDPPGGLSSAPATAPPQWTGTVIAKALTVPTGC